MEIYLIRHTTPDIAKGTCYGQSNIGLTDSFYMEMEVIRKQLPLNNKSKIYSSPLLRCYKLAASLGNQILLDSRLKEVNFGTWENQTWDNIPKKEIDPWMNDFANIAPPKGESYTELQNRVIDFFKTLVTNNTESDPIYIVSHAGPIRAWLSYIQQIALKDSFSIKIDYGQICKLQYIDDTFVVKS